MRNQSFVLAMLVFSFASSTRADDTRCHYQALPAIVGAQWELRTTGLIHTSEGKTMANDSVTIEKVITVESDHFITEMTNAGSVARIRYDCTPDGPAGSNIDAPQAEAVPGWTYSTHGNNIPAKLAVGSEWEQSYEQTFRKRTTGTRTKYKAVGKETVTVPAGTFEAVRVDYKQEMIDSEPKRKDEGVTEVGGTTWYAPDIGVVRAVHRVHMTVSGSKPHDSEMTSELIKYHIPSAAEAKANAPDTRDAAALEASCTKGVAADCYPLAKRYREGVGVQRDLPRSFNYAQKACDGSLAAACSDLGLYYLKGVGGVDKDLAKAVQLFKKACDAGEANGCANLGDRYVKGEGVGEDIARGIELYKKACDKGSAVGCFYLGVANEKGTLMPVNLQNAAALYEKACDADDADACGRLGTMYLKGIGVERNPAKTLTLAERACTLGYADDCQWLGLLNIKGELGGVNYDRAARYFTLGCRNGYAGSCFMLGSMAENGVGMEKDYAAAAALYDKACTWGNPHACYNLGGLYERGKGVGKDRTRAAELFTKACDKGEQDACTAAKRHKR